MVNVYLLTGSNLRNRSQYLSDAASAVGKLIGPVIKQSPIYSTQAWGKTDEPDYLNQALLVQTSLPAAMVLQTIHHIEASLGRQRDVQWAGRTIDIDILFYGDEVIDTADLVIPHPRLHLRNFVLKPMQCIAPALVHPVLGLTIAALAARCQDDLMVEIYSGG